MMTQHTPALTKPRLKRQRGLSIIELMIAVAISLLMMASFLVSLVNMRTAFVTQDELGQLQDKERLALTLLTNTVQAAGYFPNPTTNIPGDFFVAAANPTFGNFAALQTVMGAVASTSPAASESLSLRFVHTNGLSNCRGDSPPPLPLPPALLAPVTNIFRVNTTVTPNVLECSIDNGANWSTLINDVNNMTVLYGVDDTSTGSVTRYVGIAAMTPVLWPRVQSVRITLRFTNPFRPPGTPVTTNTLDTVQTISLMNRP